MAASPHRVASRHLTANVRIVSSFVYVSRTKYRGVDSACDEVQDLIQRLKDGDGRAADEVAKVLATHPALRGFNGVVTPAPRSTAGRPSLLRFAEALVRRGVGREALPVVSRIIPVESSRHRRHLGLPGLSEDEHAASMEVTEALDPRVPVLIVDDVHTTGSTIRGVAKALRAAGHVGPVLGATAAFVEDPPQPGDCPIHHTTF